MTDFEQAERNAFIKKAPNCCVYGCGFHYCQALMKNIGTYGLLKPYKYNQIFRHYIPKHVMLMTLPSDMVQQLGIS